MFRLNFMLFQQAVDALLELLQLFESVSIVGLRSGGPLAIAMHEFVGKIECNHDRNPVSTEYFTGIAHLTHFAVNTAR